MIPASMLGFKLDHHDLSVLSLTDGTGQGPSGSILTGSSTSTNTLSDSADPAPSGPTRQADNSGEGFQEASVEEVQSERDPEEASLPRETRHDEDLEQDEWVGGGSGTDPAGNDNWEGGPSGLAEVDPEDQTDEVVMLDPDQFDLEETPELVSAVSWPVPSLLTPRLRALQYSSPESQEGLRRYARLFHPDWERTIPQAEHYGEVPIVLNASVERNLLYFQRVINERFQEYLSRFEKYKPMVQSIFKEFGLPVELSYLSLVESGFNPRAYSRARAAGPWQFMKATGRLYGLRVNWYIDERRDPLKSTVAAAHHLRDLYDRFGSWPLALAAYNAGEGKIARAIRKSGSRDYWKIRRSWRYIRRETREYVPRFIAATMIATNPEDYGFSVPAVESHAFDEVVIKKRVHLRTIAQATGISLEELRQLNPELRRSIVPSQIEGYYLKVPIGTKDLVEQHHDAFKPWTKPPPPPTQWYRVRRGDSLSVVAKRFGMTVRTLKRLNHLRGNLIRAGDKLRVRGNPSVDPDATWYIVRTGDTLSEIAHRFETSVGNLRRLNNLSADGVIHVGDRLRVKKPLPSRGETKWYRVRRGDSLWSIAQRFSVSVTDLKVLNNLTSSVIRAGHLLLVSQ